MHDMYHEALMREADQDGDGKIYFHEFMEQGTKSDILTRVFNCIDRMAQFERQFDEMDVDGSGEVDVAEIAGLIAKSFPKTTPMMQQKLLDAVLLDTDTDRSGTVTKEELLKSSYFYLLSMADENPPTNAHLSTWGAGSGAPTPTGPKKLPLRKSPGPQGGLANRCAASSPRRSSKPHWADEIRVQSPSTQGRRSIPPIERFEAEGFRPNPMLPGEQMMEKAEREIDRESGICNWAGASEYFVDAAEIFIREGDFCQGGEAYVRASDCHNKLFNDLNAAEFLVKAAEAYAHANRDNAIDCLSEAIDIYERDGHLKTNARLHRRIAELYERTGDFKDSIDFYLQAAEYYEGPNQMALRMACLKRVAGLRATIGAYDEAIKMFEHISETILADNVRGTPLFGRLEIKDHFFRAVLCKLVVVNPNGTGLERITAIEMAEKAFIRYGEMDMENFSSGLEYDTCKILIECEYKQDLERMKKTVDHFRASRALETWVQVTLDQTIINLEAWLDNLAAQLL
uniref:EF-hand domain-containing protein n=1 Tax=Eutreptiella gymnastica TaxID=73025 RepID=A0A7S4G251_9EUGL